MACLVRDFSEFKVFMLPVRSSFYAASSIRCMINLWTGPAVCTVFGCSWHLLKLHCGWNSIQSMIKLYRHNINNKQAAQMTNVQITQYHFAHYVKTPSCILHYGQCCGPIVSNYNRANDVAMWPASGNQLLKQLMSPSPKSQVMFASAFSRIGDFFRIFGIHSFYATPALLNMSVSP